MIEAIFKLPDEKMPCPVTESVLRSFSRGEFAGSAKLEQAIKANLKGLGYGG